MRTVEGSGWGLTLGSPDDHGHVWLAPGDGSQFIPNPADEDVPASRGRSRPGSRYGGGCS